LRERSDSPLRMGGTDRTGRADRVNRIDRTGRVDRISRINRAGTVLMAPSLSHVTTHFVSR